MLKFKVGVVLCSLAASLPAFAMSAARVVMPSNDVSIPASIRENSLNVRILGHLRRYLTVTMWLSLTQFATSLIALISWTIILTSRFFIPGVLCSTSMRSM